MRAARLPSAAWTTYSHHIATAHPGSMKTWGQLVGETHCLCLGQSAGSACSPSDVMGQVCISTSTSPATADLRARPPGSRTSRQPSPSGRLESGTAVSCLGELYSSPSTTWLPSNLTRSPRAIDVDNPIAHRPSRASPHRPIQAAKEEEREKGRRRKKKKARYPSLQPRRLDTLAGTPRARRLSCVCR